MYNKIKYFFGASFAVILICLSAFLLKGDFFSFIKWWGTLFILGIIFLPLTKKVFHSQHDHGYLFSKVIGIGISGYFMWFLSSLKIIKFTSLSCTLIVFICLFINLLIMRKSKGNNNKVSFDKDNNYIFSYIMEELLFLAIFLFWTYIRGFKPEAHGTEKFMDYGFMTAMMRSDYMPPKDMWFAGEVINYYYVGQYFSTFLTKLSHVTVNVGYNLMMMTLAAFGFVLPYTLIYNVTKNYLKRHVKYKIAPVFAGLLSGAGVSFAGNLHFTLYYYIVPKLRTILGIPDKDYPRFWFPDSTRYIGYDPDTKDKTIHEFPNYSFILGDLHAHVINIIFVLTILGILYAWLLYRKKWMSEDRDKIPMNLKLSNEVFNPYILFISFFLGLFYMTNFWDFPIYFVVAGAIILFSNIVIYKFSPRLVLITALQGAVILISSYIVSLPFHLNFKQISNEIWLASSHTPLYQLIILWGLPIVLIIGLLIETISLYKKNELSNSFLNQPKIPEMNISRQTIEEIHSPSQLSEPDLVTSNQRNVNELDISNQRNIKEINTLNYPKSHQVSDNNKKNFINHILGYLSKLSISDLFIITLGLCAIGLVLMPEVIYVKDIYSGDYKRANTMFKLTYQAFILFGISAGYIFIKFIKTPNFIWQKKFFIITFLLFLSSLWYSKVSISQWYGNIFNHNNYKGLDAAAFLEDDMPDDYLGVKWLNENVEGTPVILEADGDSYTDYERISMATGLPTVLGWHVHEWLWRSSKEVVDERSADIEIIYTSKDEQRVQSLIDKYNIEYIYVGKLEQDKFFELNHDMLKTLGRVIMISEKTDIKIYETYIIQVDPRG